MNRIYLILISLMLVYIIIIDHIYIDSNWCSSEIDILRYQVDDIHHKIID
jgi:hypothetical protein